MPSLKFLKGRIKGVKSTQKITKAMQLISAARLGKAREALTNAHPYINAMQNMMQDVVVNIPITDSYLLSNNISGHKNLILVVTSDRGLCGSFNTSVIKRTKQYCADLQSIGESFFIMCVGKRGYESLVAKFGHDIVMQLPNTKEVSINAAAIISSIIVADINLGKFEKFNIIFSKFISVIKSEAQNTKVIPYDIGSNDRNHSKSMEFEPLLHDMMDKLLSRYITSVIYMALLENAASEHSARMTAMDSATRNAKEMLSTLSNKYNRTRQAVITKELIEIISGAQAV